MSPQWQTTAGGIFRRGELAEFFFGDLLIAGLRQPGEKVDVLRDLVVGKLLATPILHVVDRQLSRARADDERADRLAEDLVRHADDRHLDNLRDLRDHVLDFLGADAVTHRFDEVAGALDQKDVAVLIHPGHVAGQQLPVAKVPLRLFGVVPVAGRDVIAGGHDLAHFAGPAAHRPAVVAEHFQPRVRQASADRAELVVEPFRREVAQPGRGLGLAVHDERSGAGQG